LKTSARVHYVLAHLVLAGVVLQFLLAGLGIFDAASFVPHFIVGDLLVLVSLITLIAALLSRRARGWSAGLFVALLVQSMLPRIGESIPAIAALHVLNAVLVMYLAAVVFRGAPPSLRAVERSGPPAPAAQTAAR
jgi:hypothetical protein